MPSRRRGEAEGGSGVGSSSGDAHLLQAPQSATPHSGRSSPLRSHQDAGTARTTRKQQRTNASSAFTSRSPLYGLPGVSASAMSLEQQQRASSSSSDQLAPHLLSAETHLGKMTLTAPDNMLRRQAQEREKERRARKIIKKQARAREAMEALSGGAMYATGSSLVPLPAANALAGPSGTHPLQTSALRAATRSADQLHQLEGSRRSPSPRRAVTPSQPVAVSSSQPQRRSPSPRRNAHPAATSPNATRPRRPRPVRTASGPAASNEPEIGTSATTATPTPLAQRASLRRHNIYSDLADMGLPGMESASDSESGEAAAGDAAQTLNDPQAEPAPAISEDPPPPFPEGSTRPETPPRGPNTATEQGWTSDDERRWVSYRRRVPDSPPPAFLSEGEEAGDDHARSQSDAESASDSDSSSASPPTALDEERRAWEEDVRRGLSLADRIQRLELRRRRKEMMAEGEARQSQVALREMADWEDRAVLESVVQQSVREGQGARVEADEGERLAELAGVVDNSGQVTAADIPSLTEGSAPSATAPVVGPSLTSQPASTMPQAPQPPAAVSQASPLVPAAPLAPQPPPTDALAPQSATAASLVSLPPTANSPRVTAPSTPSISSPSLPAGAGLSTSGALSHPSLPRVIAQRSLSHSRGTGRSKPTSIRPRPSSESHSRFRDDASAAAERRRLAWGAAAPVVGLHVPTAPPRHKSTSALVSASDVQPASSTSAAALMSSDSSRHTMPGAFAAANTGGLDDEDEGVSSDDSTEAWAEEARQLEALRQAAERAPILDDSSDSDSEEDPTTQGPHRHSSQLAQHQSPMGRLQDALPKAPPPLVLGRSRGGGLAYDASDSESSSDDEERSVSDSDDSISPGEEDVVRHENPRWVQQQQQQQPVVNQPLPAHPSLTRKSLDSARSTADALTVPQPPLASRTISSSSTSLAPGVKGKAPVRADNAMQARPAVPAKPRTSSTSQVGTAAGQTSAPLAGSSSARPASVPGPAGSAAAGDFVSDSASSGSFSAEEETSVQPSTHATRKAFTSSSSSNSLWATRLPGERPNAARTEVNDRLKGLFGAPLASSSSSYDSTAPNARPNQPRRRSSNKSLQSEVKAASGTNTAPRNDADARSLATSQGRVIAGVSHQGDEQQARKAALMDIARLQNALRGPAGQPSDSSDSLAALEKILAASLRETSGMQPSSHAPLPQPLARQNAVTSRRPPPPPPQSSTPVIPLAGGATVARANSFINPRSSFAPLPRQTRLPAITDATRHFPPSRAPTVSDVGSGSSEVGIPRGAVPGSRVSALMSRFEPGAGATEGGLSAGSIPAGAMAVPTPFGPSRRRPPPPPPPQTSVTQPRSEPEQQARTAVMASTEPSPAPEPASSAPPRPALPPRTLSRTELARQNALEALTRNAGVLATASEAQHHATAVTPIMEDRPPPQLPPRPRESLLSRYVAGETLSPAVQNINGNATPPSRTESPLPRRPLPQPPGPPGMTSPPAVVTTAAPPTPASSAQPTATTSIPSTEPPPSEDAARPSTEEVQPSRAPPRREGSVGLTDLDILASQLETTGSHYDSITAITDFLGPATLDHLLPSEVSTIPLGLIEVEKRRVTKEGKIKMKLACLGIRVDKCGICLGQFREHQRAYVLMRCLHVFHEECGRGWFRRSRACAVCRGLVLEEGGEGESGV